MLVENFKFRELVKSCKNSKNFLILFLLFFFIIILVEHITIHGANIYIDSIELLKCPCLKSLKFVNSETSFIWIQFLLDNNVPITHLQLESTKKERFYGLSHNSFLTSLTITGYKHISGKM